MKLENQGIVALIKVEGMIPQDIEYGILEALAHGRQAAVKEAALQKALGALAGKAATVAVTEWTHSFGDFYQIRWERRRLFKDLLFSSQAEVKSNAERTPDAYSSD